MLLVCALLAAAALAAAAPPAAAAAAAAAGACATDLDCNLSGVCNATSGACACFAPWGGATCGELRFTPLRAPALTNGYPGATTPNETTWGGNAVRDDNGIFHLFVAEMVNGCSLAQWQTNSRCAHAVSSDPEGPYVRVDVAVDVWCHLPQVSLVRGGGFGGRDLWALWHAGTGQQAAGAVNCSAGPPTALAAAPPPSASAVAAAAAPPSSVLHVANSPFGPWEPVLTPLPDCWTPSQAQLRNGTWLIICGANSLYAAPNVTGPWRHVVDIAIGGTPGTFEDPFLYEDARGNLHALFHTYTMKCETPACDPVAIAGHSFSGDGGLTWRSSGVQPYFNTANVTDGSAVQMSTRERPKMIFDARTGEPTHLVTAVCPTPHCPPQAAIQCKVQGLGPHEGYWDHTLVVPLDYS